MKLFENKITVGRGSLKSKKGGDGERQVGGVKGIPRVSSFPTFHYVRILPLRACSKSRSHTEHSNRSTTRSDDTDAGQINTNFYS